MLLLCCRWFIMEDIQVGRYNGGFAMARKVGMGRYNAGLYG